MGKTAGNLIFLIIAVIVAFVAMILTFILFVPEKRREKLGRFGKFIHDTVNFKYLVIEKILQAGYIFATAFLIIYGFLSIFSFETTFYGKSHWVGWRGFLIMILGPLALRVVYELVMMMILLVRNVISINNKLKNQSGNPEAAGKAFAQPNAVPYANVPPASPYGVPAGNPAPNYAPAPNFAPAPPYTPGTAQEGPYNPAGQF